MAMADGQLPGQNDGGLEEDGRSNGISHYYITH
jgi:hypothetical protein